jgi:hypothetical protein
MPIRGAAPEHEEVDEAVGAVRDEELPPRARELDVECRLRQPEIVLLHELEHELVRTPPGAAVGGEELRLQVVEERGRMADNGFREIMDK